MRLFSGSCKTSTSLNSPAGILSLYSMWVLTGFSHVYCPDGLNNTSLSPGCILEAASSFGRQAKHTFQDRGWGEEALNSQVNPQSHPHDSL